jgi:hypothetical protein
LRQTVNRVYVSNVYDGGFTVSWTTDTATDGHVDWGTTTSLGNTTSDSVGSTTTHYVEVTGLSASTPYYFQVRSGSTTDDNGGAYYTVTTGPTLGLVTPGKTVWGYIYESDGSTAVPNAIMYLQVQDADSAGSSGNSQWITARTDGSGVWSYDLSSLRTADAGSYFTFTDGGDDLRLVAQGGSVGTEGEVGAEWIETVPGSYPAQFDATLNDTPNAVQVQNLTASSRAGMWSVLGLLLVGGLWILKRSR